MSKKDERYFNFPVQLLEGFLGDSKKAINNIYFYSIYSHILTYEDQEGFEWTKSADEAQLVSLADSFFGTKTGNKKECYQQGEMLHNSIPSNSPMTGMNKDLFFEFYAAGKTEFQKVCLLAHLALKSTCYKRQFSRVDKFYIYSRMDGKVESISKPYKEEYEKTNQKITFPDPEILSNLSAEIQKYATHRQWDKIRNELENGWFWTIPKKIPRMNKKGILELKGVRGANYFSQLKEDDFFELIIKLEMKDHEKKQAKEKIPIDLINKYNNKKC